MMGGPAAREGLAQKVVVPRYALFEAVPVDVGVAPVNPGHLGLPQPVLVAESPHVGDCAAGVVCVEVVEVLLLDLPFAHWADGSRVGRFGFRPR